MKRRPPIGAGARADLNALAIHDLADGRCTAVGTFTCATAAATTVVSERLVKAGDIILVVPLDATAYTKMNTASFYVAAVSQSDADAEQFTVTHANDANAGSFGYIIAGT